MKKNTSSSNNTSSKSKKSLSIYQPNNILFYLDNYSVSTPAASTSFGFGGKLFAGTRGFDPKTIILQIISL